MGTLEVDTVFKKYDIEIHASTDYAGFTVNVEKILEDALIKAKKNGVIVDFGIEELYSE